MTRKISLPPMAKPAALAAAGALALAACAGQPPSSYAAASADGAATQASATGGRSCFRVSNIRGQNVLDRDTVLFSTGVGRDDIYQVDMRSACLPGALASDPLVLRTTGASDVVCNRLDLDIGVKTPIGATPCLIESIRKLSAAEIAALAPRDRP